MVEAFTVDVNNVPEKNVGAEAVSRLKMKVSVVAGTSQLKFTVDSKTVAIKFGAFGAVVSIMSVEEVPAFEMFPALSTAYIL